MPLLVLLLASDRSTAACEGANVALLLQLVSLGE